MKINDLFKYDLLNSQQIFIKENGGILETTKQTNNIDLIAIVLIFGVTVILMTKIHKPYERTSKEN
jgi:hypothetical protein